MLRTNGNRGAVLLYRTFPLQFSPSEHHSIVEELARDGLAIHVVLPVFAPGAHIVTLFVVVVALITLSALLNVYHIDSSL